MEIPFSKEYPPRNDVVFSIMFGERDLFARLLKTVTGHELQSKDVFSQANVKPENVEHNYIRFDTYSRETDGTIYSLDMQKKKMKKLVRNRTVYYSCRCISSQTIRDGEYHKLNKVAVSFVMTSASGSAPVEKVQLYNQNHELYSDLITLYNVYIPTVLNEQEKCDPELVMLSEFFSIDDSLQMEGFMKKYAGNELAEMLIISYSKAILKSDIAEISEREYFNMKISEERINQAYSEGKEEGRAEGRAEGKIEGITEGIAEGIAKLVKAMKKSGMSDEEIKMITSMA